MRTRTLAGICAAALVGIGGLFVGTAPGAAAKGGGGSGGGGTPVDSGTVYFVDYAASSAGSWGRMNPDGTGKSLLPSGVRGEPSHGTHAPTTGGTPERWFLRLEEIDENGTPGTFTTGDYKAEIFAVTESGGRRVQLTDNFGAGIVPDHTNANAWDERCQWIGKTPGATDAKIAFLGYRVYADQTNVANWGMCVVSVDWSAIASGNWVPVQPTLVPGFVAAADRRPKNHTTGGWAQAIDFAWSPDGTAVAYAKLVNGGADILHIFDVWRCDLTSAGAAHDLLVENGLPEDWSTTGKLACSVLYGEIFSIDAATGGSYLRLIPAPRNPGPQAVYDARWSPSANYLVYVYQDVSSSNPSRRYRDIRRVTASGGSDTNLTGDVAGWLQPTGWR